MYLKEITENRTGKIETHELGLVSYTQQVLVPKTGARLICKDLKEAQQSKNLNEFDLI